MQSVQWKVSQHWGKHLYTIYLLPVCLQMLTGCKSRNSHWALSLLLHTALLIKWNSSTVRKVASLLLLLFIISKFCLCDRFLKFPVLPVFWTPLINSWKIKSMIKQTRTLFCFRFTCCMNLKQSCWKAEIVKSHIFSERGRGANSRKVCWAFPFLLLSSLASHNSTWSSSAL